MAQALALRVVPSSERPVMAARIREAATRALSLNPREGLALAARVSLEPTFMNWSNKDRMLREAMATAPANTPAVLMQRAQFLAAVGRTREALALSERASKGAPLLPWIQARRAQLLMDLSHPDEAERVLRGAEGLWPRDAGLLQMRLMFEVANGRARNLATMADRIANSDEKEFVRSLAAAGGSPASAAAITQAFYARFRRSGGDVLKGEQAFRAASALDERDAAFDVLEAVLSARALANEPTDVVAPLRPAEFDTSALFSTDAAAARRDPRFHSVIQRLGLPAFWRRTVMPDFCKERAASHAGSLC
jgi:tetratricopeptide (TPR) repeat protein